MSEPITDPEAVAFVKNKVRPLANSMTRVLRAISSFKVQYAAKGMEDKFPDDPEAIVVEGPESSAQTPLSGADVTRFVEQLDVILATAQQNQAELTLIVAKIADIAD